MNSGGDEIVRCVIEGALTTRSFLHIGGSESAEFVPTADGATVAPVVIGHDSRAVLPGSALRGAIRSQLKKTGCTDAQIDMMMGKAASEKDATAVPGKARRVFVRTAMMQEPASGMCVDDEEKCVDHISMTAINRWRKAAADGSFTKSDEEGTSSETDNTEAKGDDAGRSGGMLRTVEAVPPGVTFKVWVGIAGDAKEPFVKDEEIAAIMAALQQFNATENSFSDATLGAFRQQGWGQLQWENPKVSVLTKDALKEWLKQPQQGICGEQGWGLCTKAIDAPTIGKPESRGTGAETFSIDLELHGQSTFLTADTRERFRKPKDKTAKDKDNIEPDTRVMRTGDGKVYVSGHSIKGALRSQMERILRTRGIRCCDPTQDERKTGVEGGVASTKPRCKPIRKIEEVEGLCLACQIFGAGGWASTVEISSFIETDASHDRQPKNKSREFVGISRFTGGGADALKFSAQVADRPNLRGRITFNLKRLAVGDPIDAKLGALLHLFRDFAEGDIRFGAGGSKGMGIFKVAGTDSAAKDGGGVERDALLTVLRRKENEGIAVNGSMIGWLDAFDGCPNFQPQSATAVQLVWDKPTEAPRPSLLQQLPGSFNPYHWVSAVPSPAGLLEPVTEFGSKDHQRHDAYALNAYSGEFAVEIKPVTPIFVGGERKTHEGEPATVEPYKIGEAPAIPATSLRGLISSIYEMATASAMRVLESDKVYSYRMAADSKVTFHMIGKVSADGKSLIPWNKRPAGNGYHEGEGIPAPLKTLKVWGRVTTAALEQQDTVPTYYRLAFGSRKMPNGRTHELKLQTPDAGPIAIPIDAAALIQFHRLADECTDTSKSEPERRPYQPMGQNRGPDDLRYKLKPNDFVYFQTDDKGTHVTRLSLSQIWRSDVGESLSAKFGRIGQDIVPFNESRKNITMAESVFGFVRVAGKKSEGTEGQKTANVKPPQAYASKISLTDATFLNNVTEPFQDATTLKILASPKPPSPAFYFEPMGNETRLPKFTDLRPDHVTPPNPRGRKMYLHLQPSASTPWKTSKTGEDLSDQQATITCIKKECKFQFKLVFDNLSGSELNALCYSLQPIPGFLHKLGMGKPLGLGSVELKVVAIRAVDRMQRYTAAGFQKPRFTKHREDEDSASWTATRAKEWRDSIQDNDLKRSLRGMEVIGTTQVSALQYPMIREQSTRMPTVNETELFKWPSGNQKLGPNYGQFLRPIEPGSTNGRDALLPLPWKCHVIVIHHEPPQIAEIISNLRPGASSYQVVTTNSDAIRVIEGFDANCVIYVLGTIANVKWVDGYTAKDVRRVQLSSLMEPTNDEAKRKWHGELKKLKSALILGASQETFRRSDTLTP